MTKADETKHKTTEAFEKVRPEVRDLTAAALVEGARAAIYWFVGRTAKTKDEEPNDV